MPSCLTLSQSLVGGGSSFNQDKLSLDLQFAADKTLTARKGPTPTFTRASSATFVGSDGLVQTAAINAPRFDHDPVSPFACKGLLIEEQRINIFTFSQDFSTNWTTVRLTGQPTANTDVSPDGSQNAEKITPDGTPASNHRIDKASITLALNSVYSFSVFVKASGYTGFAVGVDAVSPVLGAQFSLVGSGSVTATAVGYTASIAQFPNGWYKCTATFTSSAAIATHRAYLYVGETGSSFTYTGDTTSGILMWGAQLELGAFPSSYIPTTTGSVTRSADVCSITNISSFYNGLGTIFVGSQLNNASMLNGICAFNTLNTQQIALNRLVNNTRAFISQSPSVTINSGTLASTLFVKSAFAFNTGDAAFANNGILITPTNTTAVLPSVNTFTIGGNGGQGMQSGTISQIKYFKKRLSNAKLQAITA